MTLGKNLGFQRVLMFLHLINKNYEKSRFNTNRTQ